MSPFPEGCLRTNLFGISDPGVEDDEDVGQIDFLLILADAAAKARCNWKRGKHYSAKHARIRLKLWQKPMKI